MQLLNCNCMAGYHFPAFLCHSNHAVNHAIIGGVIGGVLILVTTAAIITLAAILLFILVHRRKDVTGMY